MLLQYLGWQCSIVSRLCQLFSMEHFTQSISDDFLDYNGAELKVQEDAQEDDQEDSDDGGGGSLDEIDIEALLNRRRPLGLFRKRSKPLEEAPEFVKRLSSFVEAKVGDTVVFECQWKALPRPTVKWYRDEETVTASSAVALDSLPDGLERLTLKASTKEDEGAYKCKVENTEGVASTTGYLSVTGKKTLSQEHKKTKSEHSVSSAPHLRTIVEQKSVEEREGDAAGRQSPSPLQEFIDNFRREKTWPGMSEHMTPDDEELPEGKDTTDAGDAASSGSDTSVESQDYSRVSFSVKRRKRGAVVSGDAQNEGDVVNGDAAHEGGVVNGDAQNEGDVVNGESAANGLLITEESIEKAPSVEDIVGNVEMDVSEKVHRFLDDSHAGSKLSKLEIESSEYSTSDFEESTPTPTNFLDEPPLSKKSLLNSQVVSEALISATPESRSFTTPSRSRRKSATPEIERRDVPKVVSRVIAEQLDSPSIYYLLFLSVSTMIAVGTEMPVPYFIIAMMLASVVSFRILLESN